MSTITNPQNTTILFININLAIKIGSYGDDTKLREKKNLNKGN